MLPSADAAPVLAYSDASMIGEGTAGLGAVVGGKEFTRIVRTSSQQHAELEAALLAVRKAPIGQPLKLHVDCHNALQQLTQPDLLLPTFQVMVRHVVTVAHQRQIALTLQHIQGDDNPAHPVARRARLMPPNQPVSDERLYLRVRQHGPQVTVLGLGDPLVFPDHPAGFQLVADLLPQFPIGARVEIEGLGFYTRYLWQHRVIPTREDRRLLLAVQDLVVARRIHLTLK